MAHFEIGIIGVKKHLLKGNIEEICDFTSVVTLIAGTLISYERQACDLRSCVNSDSRYNR